MRAHILVWQQQLNEAWQQFRASRRLQILVVGVLVMLLVEGALRWMDHLDARRTLLQNLQEQRMALAAQSRDETALQVRLTALKTMNEDLEDRLWVVSSDAVGQARMQDWIQAVFKAANARYQGVTLITPKRSVDPAAPAGTGESDLHEFRATILFPFSPAALEAVLAQIEGGEAIAQIENLTVNRQNARVEMLVRLLMRVDKEKAPEWAARQAELAEKRAEAGGDVVASDIDAAVEAVKAAENAGANSPGKLMGTPANNSKANKTNEAGKTRGGQ